MGDENKIYDDIKPVGNDADDGLYRDLNEVLKDSARGRETVHLESGFVEPEINISAADDTEDLKAQLAAARADLYNYRQRTERERTKIIRLLTLDRIADFLPALDNLDRALTAPEDGPAKNVLIGVRMVQKQFLSILEDMGVSVIAASEGLPFDPLLHNAIETEKIEDPALDGVILRELARGYRSSERVMRAAQVRVGRYTTDESYETN
ncbi:protein GrpE [Synergistales bacterium]|nr:protein GrpE [Synergistales bacterium]